MTSGVFTTMVEGATVRVWAESDGQAQNTAWRGLAEAKLKTILGDDTVKHLGGPFFQADDDKIMLEALTYNSPAHLAPNFTILTRKASSTEDCFWHSLKFMLRANLLLLMRVDCYDKLKNATMFDLALFAEAIRYDAVLFRQILATNKMASGRQSFVTVKGEWLPPHCIIYREVNGKVLFDDV